MLLRKLNFSHFSFVFCIYSPILFVYRCFARSWRGCILLIVSNICFGKTLQTFLFNFFFVDFFWMREGICNICSVSQTKSPSGENFRCLSLLFHGKFWMFWRESKINNFPMKMLFWMFWRRRKAKILARSSSSLVNEFDSGSCLWNLHVMDMVIVIVIPIALAIVVMILHWNVSLL